MFTSAYLFTVFVIESGIKYIRKGKQKIVGFFVNKQNFI